MINGIPCLSRFVQFLCGREISRLDTSETKTWQPGDGENWIGAYTLTADIAAQRAEQIAAAVGINLASLRWYQLYVTANCRNARKCASSKADAYQVYVYTKRAYIKYHT